jgi:hypothetical protein
MEQGASKAAVWSMRSRRDRDDAKAENMNARETRRKQLSNRRQRVALGPKLERSLSAYASAALASGVSLLAITASSEAKIVYTPAHADIPTNGGRVFLDLNHDGLADFYFRNSNYFAGPGDGSGFSLRVACALSHSTTFAGCLNKSNKVWGQGVRSRRFASALSPGFKVGPNKSHFQQPAKGIPGGLMARFFFGGNSSGSYNGTSGQWLYTTHRYLGMQFAIGNQVHYGWARVSVTLLGVRIHATLTGYAYETIPNKPIVTGKTTGADVITLDPATLGHLAQGTSGISVWRAKK